MGKENRMDERERFNAWMRVLYAFSAIGSIINIIAIIVIPFCLIDTIYEDMSLLVIVIGVVGVVISIASCYIITATMDAVDCLFCISINNYKVLNGVQGKISTQKVNLQIGEENKEITILTIKKE